MIKVSPEILQAIEDEKMIMEYFKAKANAALLESLLKLEEEFEQEIINGTGEGEPKGFISLEDDK